MTERTNLYFNFIIYDTAKYDNKKGLITYLIRYIIQTTILKPTIPTILLFMSLLLFLSAISYQVSSSKSLEK